MVKISNWWQQVTQPRDSNAGMARREYITRVVFIMMGLTLLVFSVPILISLMFGVFQDDTLPVLIAMDLPIGLGCWLTYKGYWKITRMVPVSVSFGLAL